MSAPALPVGAYAPASSRRTGDPLPARLLTVGLVAVLAAILLNSREALAAALTENWPDLLFWFVLATVVNFFPVVVGALRLTLDFPIFLALALLYPPPVAALVSFVAALDARELRHEVTLVRAMFNRGQIGICVFLASVAFHQIVGDPGLPIGLGSIGTLGALVVDFASNVVLVAAHQALLSKNRFGATIRFLTWGQGPQFLFIYVGYGALAGLLAHLFDANGPLPTLAFLIPLIVARVALSKSSEYRVLLSDLQEGERMLHALLDRAADERQDERLRIAGDLHDEILQSLIEIRLLAARTNTRANGASEDVQQMLEATDRTVDTLRRVIHDLHESPVGSNGLIQALTGLVRDFRLDWRIRIKEELPKMVSASSQAQVVCYQIAREALLNAAKHSRAENVRLVVRELETELEVEVSDDGIGFDLAKIDESNSFGLKLLRERTHRSGGTLLIETELEKGTRLLATLPRVPEAEKPRSDLRVVP